MSILVIDFETFKFDWCCVVVDLTTKQETTIVNDKTKLEQFYKSHKNNLWVGHNIRGFDQWVLKAILCDFDPFEMCNWIIVKGRKGHEFSRQLNKFPLNFYDTMPQPPVGLKTLEGFMGSDIRETTVPFDIDRKLTKEELDEVLFYCRHDVQQTCMVFAHNLKEFTAQLELVKMFDLPINLMGKTKAQLGATILGAQRKEHKDEWDFQIPDTLRIEKYKFVVDWFLNLKEETKKNIETMGYDEALANMYAQKLECDIAGVPHIFAWGGLHGAIPKYVDDGYFVIADVGSFYPSMMIEYDYISRNIKDPQKYRDIYYTRLEHKKNGDPRQKPMKIILNSNYGSLKDKYNQLYDPRQANSVCVSGQLLLLDLIEHLEPYFDIVNSNTDGVMVKLRATNEAEATREYELFDDICYEWEQRTRMTLEFDEFKRVVQKDVNGYIFVPSGDLYDKKGKPRWKSKGGYVKSLSSLDYDLPIVNKAILEYFLKDVPVEQTVNNCHDLMEFQKIYKVSSKYVCARHNEQDLNEKVFRVFASKNHNCTALFKVKDKGDKGLVAEKFASCPDHCFIDNGNVVGKPVPDELDKEWYCSLAKERIAQFLGEN